MVYKRVTKSSAEAVLDGDIKGWRRLLPFLGPAFIAAVAYIDPGNFATNITAGSQYGYLLLWVIAFSNLMAVLIQSLSAKLGIATGKNLPEVAREHFSKKTSIFLWIQAELVIIATDLAEFIGAALGLYLLFNIPMLPAALITAVGSFAILELQRRGFRAFEAGISGMVLIVVLAFAFQTFLAQPAWDDVAIGMFTPHFEGVDSLLLATGILGATVMPHAIYLHSSLTQSRIIGRNEAEKKRIFRFEFIDIIIAMIIAGAINMSMLIIAAAVFHTQGVVVEDLDVAYNGLKVALGPMAAISFGLGLLIAGLASSSVGTLAGDVVMQGFIQRKIPLYLRRAITMVPPLAIIASGVNATYALVLSQVVLSFGIAFALVPLVMFTSKRDIMGSLVNHRITTVLGWFVVVVVVTLNIYLLWETIFG
ncbi:MULTISPECIES: Nramp family divalent metal transporter [Lysinibacillus]|uniref:Nramp family divalent metal transporter n=1 Tax=Lysinibacillus TaxID=400634 RepID=UPI0021A5AF15|nr:Nramp family divalent metal transporter [Lysinibacillus capsici]MCT1541734.1 Nramp family divalent metal transporter [Lysinibacillus capsici]MCT1572972.1 Nramp family divalent metal transporter [Lysinibacillus capsici]MCT1650091.1 Nramp family divalent metal transporter [Lysinibacillus capsici]MCT1728475.1 Nramp family divalent metal transporter [Lysinibacillus capsici]MCT1786212.1 Nramp family divalent metal transporter [Lysinibacillus capsici]